MGDYRKMISIQWAKEIEPYNKLNRVKVFYQKNGKDQNATFMDYGEKYLLVEDEHYSRNGLKEDEIEQLAEYVKHFYE